jgi:hypothetical protein
MIIIGSYKHRLGHLLSQSHTQMRDIIKKHIKTTGQLKVTSVSISPNDIPRNLENRSSPQQSYNAIKSHNQSC